jgi:hypothetical protein
VVDRAELAECHLDLGERRAPGAQEDVPAHVDHAEAQPLVLDHARPVTGLAAQEIGRAQDARLGVEVWVDLLAVVGVIAERDRVDPGGEQLVGDLRRDPEAAGDVLGIDDDERRRVALAQQWQAVEQRAPPEPADDVSDEQNARRRRLQLSHTLAMAGGK